MAASLMETALAIHSSNPSGNGNQKHYTITTVTIIKQNAKAFSLNAIVDVRHRRRHHEMNFLGNISETIRASNFNIYHKVALDSLYISTGNEVINYFSDRKQIVQPVNFGSFSGHDFSITVQPILKRFTVLESVIQGLHLLLCNLLDIFAP